jgi:alkylhydroperoxidase/carboxymuconolactone decarboxylase family protein YurZ
MSPVAQESLVVQRRYVEMIAAYHPDLYGRWQAQLETALEDRKLDRRSEAVMLAAICAVVHWAPAVIEAHIEHALDTGSNVGELLEAMLRVGSQEGNHAMSSGGEALWEVIQRRRLSGQPLAIEGDPLSADDLVPHSAWLPAVFPYHTPWPRYWQRLTGEFAPDRAKYDKERNQLVAKLPRHLSRRLEEVLDVVIDAVVRWKEPRIDHHTHEALNCGSNVQELIEFILASAEAAQGARDSHVSGRSVESGTDIVVHGLSAIDRVVRQRESAGRYTPRTYGDPIPAPDASAGS